MGTDIERERREAETSERGAPEQDRSLLSQQQ
jgi:hypothetical protein